VLDTALKGRQPRGTRGAIRKRHTAAIPARIPTNNLSRGQLVRRSFRFMLKVGLASEARSTETRRRKDDDEDSLPDEALRSVVGSSVNERSRENDVPHEGRELQTVNRGLETAYNPCGGPCGPLPISLVFIDSGTCGVDAGAGAAASPIAPTLSSAKEQPERVRPETVSIAAMNIATGSQNLNFRGITDPIIGAN